MLSLSFFLQDIQKDSCESNHNITCKVGYPFLKPAEEVKSLPACKFSLPHVALKAGQSISPLKLFSLVFIPQTLYACFPSYPWCQLHRARWETRSVGLQPFHGLEPISLVILCIKFSSLIVERIRYLCGSTNPDVPKSGTKTSPLLCGEWEAFPASSPLKTKLHPDQFQWCLYLLLEWRGSFG